MCAAVACAVACFVSHAAVELLPEVAVDVSLVAVVLLREKALV